MTTDTEGPGKQGAATADPPPSTDTTGDPPAQSADASGDPAPPEEAASAQTAAGDSPRLAEGVELIGEYEGSGYKEPPLIARRADGQVVQLTEMLYRIAERCDGQHDVERIADEVGSQLGKDISEENVRVLIDEKIRPLGILKNPDGSDPQVERVNPFLALKFRTGLVPDRIVRGLTTIFRPLYWPPVLLAAVGAFLAFDVWLFLVHGIGSGIHDVMYQPILLLVMFGLLVLATAFHEIGHATACRYGGAEPGKIGFGIYLVWPAFYTDVTDAYRLGKWARIRVDLGGVYFNAVFILAEAALYWYTGYEPLLIAIAVQHLEMLHQFLPFVRLDGYYVVSDLVGVPDLFTRMKPLLQSLLPGRKTDPSVQQLKPKVRFAVTAWVLIVIPVLLFQLTIIVLHAPRIFGTGIDSLGKLTEQASTAFSEGAYVEVGSSSLQIGALALPMLGIAYMLLRLTKQTGTGAWRHSDGRPMLRTAYMTSGIALLALIGWTWWPNGDYAPIDPKETWTLQTGVAAVRHATTGRAGLVPADPRAADDPFRAAPSTDGTQPLTPEEAFDDDAAETPDPDEGSGIDPETSVDPFFDPTPAPRRARTPAPSPTTTDAPPSASAAPATAQPSP
jgi:putative peptide zinc metalloprotease protein